MVRSFQKGQISPCMPAKWASPSTAAIHNSWESTSAPTRWYPGGTCTMAFSSLPTRSGCGHKKNSPCKHNVSTIQFKLAAESQTCDVMRAFSSSALPLTRALLAVSHVGSTARRVTVPAVMTWGNMAPYWPSSSNSLCLWETERLLYTAMNSSRYMSDH